MNYQNFGIKPCPKENVHWSRFESVTTRLYDFLDIQIHTNWSALYRID